MSDYDDQFMTHAFKKAREALTAGEVPVGCAFVEDNTQVISEARNTVNKTKNATRHAEINALDYIEYVAKERGVASSSLFPSISVYVNVEPCIMCAAALMKVRVKSIYYGCKNEKFGGCGSVADLKSQMASLVVDYDVGVSGGHRAEEAIQLLKDFYNGENPYAPNPKLKGERIQKSTLC